MTNIENLKAALDIFGKYKNAEIGTLSTDVYLQVSNCHPEHMNEKDANDLADLKWRYDYFSCVWISRAIPIY